MRNGVNFVQKDQDSNFIGIGHANDLVNLGIEILPMVLILLSYDFDLNYVRNLKN